MFAREFVMTRRIAFAALLAASISAAPWATPWAGRASADDTALFDSSGSGVVQTSFLDCLDGPSGCGDDCDGCDACDLSRHGDGIFDGRFLQHCDAGDGEPFSLFGEVAGFTIGGWAQLGYHSQNLPLFNSRKYDYQLHQAWLYAERATDGSCGLDIGGRIDYVYGTDAQDTQSFGIDNGHWDNQWDNGPDYGHALPQVYGEVAYGDWSTKIGHFYTIIGYEVVTAPDNFFYSHAYTFFNSEPFTHTGVLSTYSMTEDIDYFGGYVMGWDSGFEDNGDAFLGGSSIDWTDDLNVTSTIVVGRFADNAGGNERGVMSSTVAQLQLTEPLSYVLQIDVLDTEGPGGETARQTFDINQYVFREINDRLSIGARVEWWNVDADSSGFRGDNADPNFDFAGDYDVYAVTLGANLRPHANVIIRPEIRWDFLYGDQATLVAADLDGSPAADASFLDSGDDEQTTFAIDSIILF